MGVEVVVERPCSLLEFVAFKPCVYFSEWPSILYPPFPNANLAFFSFCAALLMNEGGLA
jgi:hypothetical protein